MSAGTASEERSRILSYLHRQLVGPMGGETEILQEHAHKRYLTGILFPIERQHIDEDSSADSTGTIDEYEIVDEVPGEVGPGEETDDDPISLAGQLRPSSVGLSFVTSHWAPIEVELRAARYLPVDDGKAWQRSPVSLAGSSAVRIQPPAKPGRTQPVYALGNHVSFESVWRRHRNGAIVTVSVVNRREYSGPSFRPEDCLLQVVLRCRPTTGVIERYPSRRHLYSDSEAEELDLLYGGYPTYALGHGAAALWTDVRDGHPGWVETSFLPSHTVHDVSFEVAGNTGILSLSRLADIEADPQQIVAELEEFVAGYERWYADLERQAVESVPAHLRAAASRLLGRISSAQKRMRRGIRLLADDPVVRRAFALANRAMLMQMVHGGPELAGAPHSVASAPPMPAAYPDDRSPAEQRKYWRPFQLGFLLLTIEGTAYETPDRDLVDLIWFPTGGGKTEAYLGLAAFTIILRRLRHQDDGAGTAVITRYTLRLLTSQQFRRAATMVAACELIRRGREDELGRTPISIGLWVGGGNSPNTYSEARDLLDKLKSDQHTDQSFQIEACPWCGTRIIPENRHSDEWGIRATNNSVTLHCLNPACPFSDQIPVSSVDEALYENPPTVLIGTVDKFARLVWDDRAGIFLGAGELPGPSLIIQDEFHLISGPLGTIVGLYEAAFDVLMESNGSRPKIVASTATIRRADEQTRGVFGRDVALFPPAGLTADDSYFVRVDRSTPGRLYAGIMPQGHTPVTGLVHLAAAALDAPSALELSETARDAYWTLVIYHNSLRELGKTVTLAHDDIPARLKIIAGNPENVRDLDDDNIVELTSNVPPAEIPRVLDRLGRPCTDPRAVSVAASTNMLSVGVDVGRLGLMTVVGQPKTTAEYIQATSRVGRQRNRPGLVLVLYSPSKPRDRSHYESFVPYHQALYRSVEPTSVTPFSLPARRRALHADLVILARHACGWLSNDEAAAFDPQDPRLSTFLELLVRRAERADPSEADNVRSHLDDLVRTWGREVAVAEEDGGLLYSGGRDRPRLLCRFDDTSDRHTEQTPWPTQDSMRSVDVEIAMTVRGEPR